MSSAASLDPDLAHELPTGSGSPQIRSGFSGGPRATSGSPGESIEAVLEFGLAQVVPGFELLDRTLEIADRTHVHLVGVDRAGALVLVALAPGDGETAPVRALESMEFVERNREPLLRHLRACSSQAARLDGALATRYLVVADLFSERTRRRLSPLVSLGVEAYELKSLRSQGRQTTFLDRVVGPVRESTTSSMSPVEIGPEHTRLAELLRRRLSGLDERVEGQRTHRGIAYRIENEPVAEVDLPAGSPGSGRVPGGPSRLLDSASAVDDFVAEIVDSYLRRNTPEDPGAEFAKGGFQSGAGPNGW